MTIYIDGSTGGGGPVIGVSGDYFKGGTSIVTRKRRRSSQILQLTKAKVQMVTKTASFRTVMPGTEVLPGMFEYFSADGLLYIVNAIGTSGTVLPFSSGSVYAIPIGATVLDLVALTTIHAQRVNPLD